MNRPIDPRRVVTPDTPHASATSSSGDDPSVLMYHSVTTRDDPPPSDFIVTASAFKAQLRHLKERGYRTPTVDELIDGRALVEPGRPSVMLTFDDGYLDNYTVALPLLLEHGFTATVFAIADFRRRENWWDAPPSRGCPLLEPRQMREMQAHGIAFGSHGLSHRAMSSLSDADLTRELVDSRHRLEDLLGAPVRSLAYPYGVVCGRVKRAAARAGYHAAFAVSSGPYSLRRDLYEIRRNVITNVASDLYMAVKLSRLYQAWRCLVGEARSLLRFEARGLFQGARE